MRIRDGVSWDAGEEVGEHDAATRIDGGDAREEKEPRADHGTRADDVYVEEAEGLRKTGEVWRARGSPVPLEEARRPSEPQEAPRCGRALYHW